MNVIGEVLPARCSKCRQKAVQYVVLSPRVTLCLKCYTPPSPEPKKVARRPSKEFRDKQRLAEEYKDNLRKKATKSEIVFRKVLVRGKIKHKFQRAFIADGCFYICDFVFEKDKVCVEIDGGYHTTPQQRAKDAAKDAYLRRRGFNVVRIQNQDVDKLTVEKVKDLIARTSPKINRGLPTTIYSEFINLS